MDKPCTTDEFVNALVKSNREKSDYDFYDIEYSLIHWVDGEYESALTFIDKETLEMILDESYEITSDITGCVVSVSEACDAS